MNGALDNQTPMLIAYRDDGEHIHLSFRGTVQAYSDEQLALWARDPQAGLPRNIAAHPEVTLFYHDPARRTSYSFQGRARIESDPEARDRIFDNSNPREQYMDYHRRGAAIVVDLDRVEGRGPGGAGADGAGRLGVAPWWSRSMAALVASTDGHLSPLVLARLLRPRSTGVGG